MNSSDFYRKYYVTLAMFRMGGSYWTKWYEGDATTPGWTGYPAQVVKYVLQEGEDKLYWPGNCAGGDSQSGGGSEVGDAYATAMACLILEGSFEEHWIDASWTPAGGKCSYGYNNRLGKSRRQPAADTIIVMDYENWEIDHDDLDVTSNDTVTDIAARTSDSPTACSATAESKPMRRKISTTAGGRLNPATDPATEKQRREVE